MSTYPKGKWLVKRKSTLQYVRDIADGERSWGSRADALVFTDRARAYRAASDAMHDNDGVTVVRLVTPKRSTDR